MNYYNDNDRAACGWLRELIADGLIVPQVAAQFIRAYVEAKGELTDASPR